MSKTMRHPDLGDLIEVPDFAIKAFEQRGYAEVNDEEPALADDSEHPRPTPGPVDTTSETAPAPGSDDGQPAVTPAG